MFGHFARLKLQSKFFAKRNQVNRATLQDADDPDVVDLIGASSENFLRIKTLRAVEVHQVHDPVIETLRGAH